MLPREEVYEAGLAFRVILAGIALAVFSLLWTTLDVPFDRSINESEKFTNMSQVATGRSWVVAYWDALPFVVLMFFVFYLIVNAVLESSLR